MICHQEFRSMMEEVAELWGEDVREDENRDRVEMMIRSVLGSEVMELVGGFREESYP